jgi:predicted site-specific integrase-resolvase
VEWARLQGVHPQTAYLWFREGTLPVPAVRVNTELVEAACLRTGAMTWCGT